MSFPIKSNIPYSTYCNLHLRQWIRCTGSVLCSYRYHPGPVSPNWYNLKRIWRRSTQTSRRLCRWGGTDASLVFGRGPCPVIVTFLPFNTVLCTNIYFTKNGVKPPFLPHTENVHSFVTCSCGWTPLINLIYQFHKEWYIFFMYSQATCSI